ncbi:TRAP transporter small permease [Anditalea andensis]|uniref:C4-dicarboxylate ABC transporter permease n=1 Tax=Anditalea andensis TaxID=1048983 RepID=A0A074L5L3_9BACT|nr:TRAP transporter small permease [Anditalea andensis]KEO75775.1 C4-dicarboxylate ABC transporter permease [Anditalea andensis]
MFSIFYKNKVDKLVGTALVILMSLMVLNVTWQVISRYVLMNPSAFTDELSRYMLIWLGMLGAAYVAGQDKHLAIDLLPQKLTGKPKQNLLIIINVVIIFFAVAVMVLGGLNLVYITFILDQKSATLQVPLAFVYTIIPFSGLVVTYYQIVLISSHLNSKNISA